MKYGKGELQKMEDVLNAEHESVGAAAEAVLAAFEEIFEARSKFVVVGQLSTTPDHRELDPSDPEAIKMSLGWYSTEGDARKAAESLWSSTASGDTFRCWVLPVHNGTAADFHAKRKAQYVAAAEKAKEKDSQRIKDGIAKRMAEAEARNQAGAKGLCQNCDHHPYDHKTDGSSRGECGLTACDCPRWSERKKAA